MSKDNDKKTEQSSSLDGLVDLPLELAENLRDYLWELRGEREWWQHETRRTYQEDYAKMTSDIEQIQKIIKQAMDS